VADFSKPEAARPSRLDPKPDQRSRKVDILFVSSIAIVTPDPQGSRKLFMGALGLPLESDATGDYFHSDAIEGSKHFGVWPLSEAAIACFDSPDWPDDRPVPQASVEFEVGSEDAVRAAEAELRSGGFDVLHSTKTEPWGQTIMRVQEAGAIVGISFAPWMHKR
jgi:catechol 2,3-dioxygenase-like lactoylglutathione lyase family enzyme